MGDTDTARTPGRARRTTALYVDFDNAYTGLSRIDSRSAQTFATNPGRWLRWLADGEDEDGPFTRRFLVRSVYLNPLPYGRYRSYFVAAGFRVVDCPSMTQSGKSSADIHLVLDAYEALAHPARYDEFAVFSADADFAPLMVRLATHDRRTLMIATGNAAPAYTAVCDVAIGAAEFVELALTVPDAPAGSPPPDPADGVGPPAEPSATVAPGEVVAAARAVRQAVTAASGRLAGSTAAAEAMKAVPALRQGWAGEGRFSAFVDAHVPGLRFVRDASGGWVVDRRRYAEFSLTEDSDDLPTRVCRVTRAPLLTSAQYGVLFRELAADLRDSPVNLPRTSASVRDRAAEDAGLSRGAVSFVLQGLLSSGDVVRQADVGARELADAWCDRLLEVCAVAGMQLSESEVLEVREWVTGPTSTTPGRPGGPAVGGPG